ncbi:MAG TPA: sulfatase [Solirubrobacterales bacterium]|nr:sulfatase [Solirubrobacterales bacterium]
MSALFLDGGPPPNILYIHSHDTGRYVQPYGYAVPTPNIQLLADQGVLFRQAFCAMPTCSGSRACLLTGQGGAGNGMLGLAHRGWVLNDYRHHLVHSLRGAGYHSALIGEQHISREPGTLGYDEVIPVDTNHAHEVAPIAIETLRSAAEPLFLSVGFFETHRDFAAPTSVRDTLYSLPPPNLPDTPRTRQDMAAFKASARSLDQGIGAVLNGLHQNGLAERTLIICTTDHGLAFPGAKATLFDRGTGVMLIMRGPGGFAGGKVFDAMVSHLDIYPTVCDLVGIDQPEWLEGTSLMPLVRGHAARVHDEIFTEMTYHAAYQPQRAIRTERWKYIRRFDDSEHPVLVNCDDSASKALLVEHGWADQTLATEQLYDLVFDPSEARNVAGEPANDAVLAELRDRLRRWMAERDDPLLEGPVPPPPGAQVNDPSQISPTEPTRIAKADPTAAPSR